MFEKQSFIPDVTNRVDCKKHEAPIEEPCWSLETINVFGYQVLGGVCNSRAVKAGYNHPIDPKSLQRSGKK